MQKFRWSKVYESSEEELTAFLRDRAIEATRIASEASSEEARQSADIGSTLWCAEGSLIIRTESTSTSLQPGDALHISAQTSYDLPQEYLALSAIYRGRDFRTSGFSLDLPPLH